MALMAAAVQTLIREGVPMAQDIDLRVDEIADSYAKIRIPFAANNLRPGGSISGPVMMAAGDAAMFAAILGALGEVTMAVTSNLNINFLQRPAPSDLLAEARILKLGKRIAFCEVSLFSEGSDELVAHVSGSYALPPKSSEE